MFLSNMITCRKHRTAQGYSPHLLQKKHAITCFVSLPNSDRPAVLLTSVGNNDYGIIATISAEERQFNN
jgi:hypothetical protein